MLTSLLIAATAYGGGCAAPQRFVLRSKAVAVKQAIAVQPQAVAYVAPVVQQQAVYPQAYFAYTVGANANESERLDRLERLLLTQAQTTNTIASLLAAQQGVAPAPVSSLEDDARSIISTHCLKCHGADGNPKGNPPLDLGGAITPGEMLLIAEMVASGEMPPNKPLSDEDKKTMIDWSRQDKEAVRATLRGR